jgi:hypothetical protein
MISSNSSPEFSSPVVSEEPLIVTGGTNIPLYTAYNSV